MAIQISFDGHLSQQRSEGRRLVYDLYLCFIVRIERFDV